MPGPDYGLCDTDSSDDDPVVVGGVSDACLKKRVQRREADAAVRHRKRMRAIDAEKKRLRRVKESAEQRRLRLEAERLRDRRRRAMKRRMAESGEDPVLRFDSLEDNREIPVRFDGIEMVNESGGIEERREAAPGEARRQLNREFVARVRANMPEEEVLRQRETNAEAHQSRRARMSEEEVRMERESARAGMEFLREGRSEEEVLIERERARVGMQSFRNNLSGQERIEIQAINTEAHRTKRRRVRNEEIKKYEMRFDMTEEEYFKIMKEEGVDYDVVFQDSAKNLAKAVHLFYANSGCGENGQYREYDRRWEGKLIDQEDICKQVEAHKSTCDDYFRMFDKFFSEHSYTNACLYSCGACGYRIRERLIDKRPVTYVRYRLGSDELLPLRYNEEQTGVMKNLQEYYKTKPVMVPHWDEKNKVAELREIEPWRVMSMYESRKHGFYHLHPELVDVDNAGTESVLLCPYCSDSVKNVNADPLKRIPRYSIASGVDFGYYKRVGLTEPNLHEEIILGRVRAVIASYKIKSNMCGCRTMTRDKMQCNAILFCQEEFEKLSEMLNGHEMFDEKGLELLIHIFLMDDKGELDKLVHMACGRADILARPSVVAEWITVLIHVHVYYKDLEVPSAIEIMKRIDKTNNSILKKATRVDEVLINEVERTVGSDVAQVQQMDDGMEARFTPLDTGLGEDGLENKSVGVRVSCAIRPPERCLQGDEVYRFARLKSLRNLVGPGAMSYENKKCEGGEDYSSGEEEGRQREEIGIDINGIRDRLGIGQSGIEAEREVVNGICRNADPVNEFLEPDSVVTAAFPTVFMLGTAYKKPMGRLCGHARHHLLHQFTMVPSKCRRFLLYLFDATSRLSSINSVNAYVGKHERARKVIRDLMENPAERAALEDAYHNPKSDAAKAFLKKYLPYLRFLASKVGYGLGLDSTLQTQLKETGKRFQVPSGFFTFSFDDMNNPRAIWATFATVSNRQFPAVFEDGCKYGLNGAEFMDKIRQCSENPIEVGDIGLSESV
jgi:hypothetical protein